MRYHALYHITGITIFVLYFLFLLSNILKTVFEDTTQYALRREELSVSDERRKDNGTSLIPKIIHQVYLGFDGSEMPAEWVKSRQSCIDLHPDYRHMLWSNVTARELLENEYPWFLPTYDNYRYPIQRADSIRYFILAHHGGLYVDLDNGCRRNLDPLLSFPAWMPGTKIQVGLTNHVMGTKKGHPYVQLLTDRLQTYDYNWILPYMTIMNSAGPHFVSMVWEEYLNTSPPHEEEVRILMQAEYAGNEWSFFTKTQGGTWNHWDTAAFKWVGEHLVFFIFVCFVSLCAAMSCIWWIGVRLAGSARTTEVRSFQGLPLWQKSD